MPTESDSDGFAEDTQHSGDESVWTDFETEEGSCGSTSVDGNLVWGAFCPQPDCGALNSFEGDPSKFANRTYRCVECNWVSLMDESVADVAEVTTS